MDGSRHPAQLALRPPDLEALQDDVEHNLRHGRAFVADASTDGFAERDACTLVLVHPESGDTLELAAEVVWVKAEDPGRGVGVELVGFGSEDLARLEAFATEAKKAPQHEDIHLRVRRYSTAEQLRGAREGDLPERVALERVYGKLVWEVLLQNPRITVPEVSRIARKGNVPQPILELIAGNAAWLGSAELRRALLSNQRLSRTACEKVLRSLPRAELTLVSRQTRYPMPVRQAAKKLQGR